MHKADEITGGTRRHPSPHLQPTPETTDPRVDQLERRLLQAETLLNYVMQQLDQSVSEINSSATGNRIATRSRNRRIR